jgi:hypothetical protein
VNGLHGGRCLKIEVNLKLSNHGGHLRVEGPARNEILHGHGIVASTQAVLQIKLVLMLLSCMRWQSKNQVLILLQKLKAQLQLDYINS